MDGASSTRTFGSGTRGAAAPQRTGGAATAACSSRPDGGLACLRRPHLTGTFPPQGHRLHRIDQSATSLPPGLTISPSMTVEARAGRGGGGAGGAAGVCTKRGRHEAGVPPRGKKQGKKRSGGGGSPTLGSLGRRGLTRSCSFLPLQTPLRGGVSPARFPIEAPPRERVATPRAALPTRAPDARGAAGPARLAAAGPPSGLPRPAAGVNGGGPSAPRRDKRNRCQVTRTAVEMIHNVDERVGSSISFIFEVTLMW